MTCAILNLNLKWLGQEYSKVTHSLADFYLVSRVVASGMSMAWEFLFSKDISCNINVDSRPLSRTTFPGLEGHGLGSSEGDGACSVSQASLGEVNGDMNLVSSNE